MKQRKTIFGLIAVGKERGAETQASDEHVEFRLHAGYPSDDVLEVLLNLFTRQIDESDERLFRNKLRATRSGASAADPRAAPGGLGHLRDARHAPGRERSDYRRSGAPTAGEEDRRRRYSATRPGSRAARFALGRGGSELARVDLEHIEWRPEGLLIKIPQPKTNMSGEPEVIGVPKFVGDPPCPVAALAARVHYAHLTAGAVFVTLSPVAGKGGKRIAPLDISRRLEAIAAKAGLPGIWRSHSLRRGVLTSAEEYNGRGPSRHRPAHLRRVAGPLDVRSPCRGDLRCFARSVRRVLHGI